MKPLFTIAIGSIAVAVAAEPPLNSAEKLSTQFDQHSYSGDHHRSHDDLFTLEEDSMIIKQHDLPHSKLILTNSDEDASLKDDHAEMPGQIEADPAAEIVYGKQQSNEEIENIGFNGNDVKKSDEEIINQEMFSPKSEQTANEQSNEQSAKNSTQRARRHFINDKGRDTVGRGRNNKTRKMFEDVRVQDRKRPIYGVLSEPMKASILHSVSDNLNTGGFLDDIEDIQIAAQKPQADFVNSTDELISYVPKAHVQFLEQSGVRVIPISYLDDFENMEAVLDQVNGVYIAGDSQRSIADKHFIKALSFILEYVKTHNAESDYFPMFLMGKSSQILSHLISTHKTNLHDMLNHQNKNQFLRLLNKHEETFLLHQLQNDSSISHAFDLGEFFNRQDSGLMVRDLEDDVHMKKFIQPIATFEGSGTTDSFYVNRENKQDTDYYNDKEEFIAIAEGRDIPLYMFTYNIEMTQFVHTAIEERMEQDEVIDKCIAARHHAQFVSHQIADEGRMNEHAFDRQVLGPLSTYLIRNYEVASVEYPSNLDDESKNDRWPLPTGLEKHDVYIIKQSQIQDVNGKFLNALELQQN